MNCENCNRLNITRAYCFFKQNQYLFRETTGKVFSLHSYIAYALDNLLVWKLPTSCPFLTRQEFVLLWQSIEDDVVREFRKRAQENQRS